MADNRASAEFVAEANEILETLLEALSTLDEQREQEPDPDLLNSIFRAAHSLKGLSGMFGVERLSHLAHRAEDVLDALRLGRVALGDELLKGLFEAHEVMRAVLAEAASGVHTPRTAERATAMEAALTQLATGTSSAAADLLDEIGIPQELRSVFTEYEEHRLRHNVKKGVTLWKVRAVFSLDDFDQRLGELNAKLKPLGEVISTLPSSRPGDEASIAFDLIFGSKKEKKDVEAAVTGLGEVSPLASKPAPSAPPAPPPAGKKKGATKPPPKLPIEPTPPPGAGLVFPADFTPLPGNVTALPFPSSDSSSGSPVPTSSPSEVSLRSLSQTVRVDIGRLDGLMNVIGELLLVRGNIQRLAESARQAGVTPLPKLWGQELQKETRSLERKLDELQKGVLDVRMVPLGQVFDKLARLMRRLVRESGKAVDFEVSGGDVELDKLIVEELSDPLMHLLRNALDHGVETPEVRRSHGKGQRARIRLMARQQGNHVVIEVGDDGAGMDEQRIREVAVSRGLVSFEQTASLDRRDLLNLVFQPGFSTRADVSELSGRGVGLDVVKTNLARLSGLIDIESMRGEGTTFRLTLPLTLAIIRALMVQASGQVYAVPLNSVLEIVSVKPEELKTIERREVIELRGQTLPFVRLARVFGLTEEPRDRFYVVVVGLAQQRLGLAVDELEGQQDIVTKPLGGRLRATPGITGATELGDRRAVLVLDVGALMEELLRPHAAVGER